MLWRESFLLCAMGKASIITDYIIRLSNFVIEMNDIIFDLTLFWQNKLIQLETILLAFILSSYFKLCFINHWILQKGIIHHMSYEYLRKILRALRNDEIIDVNFLAYDFLEFVHIQKSYWISCCHVFDLVKLSKISQRNYK